MYIEFNAQTGPYGVPRSENGTPHIENVSKYKMVPPEKVCRIFAGEVKLLHSIQFNILQPLLKQTLMP